MAGATSKLSILIDAKNQASGTLKEVERQVSSLDDAAGSAANGLSGLFQAAGIAGVGALAAGVASAAFELAQLGAEAARTETAFTRLASQAGQSADQMLAAMQTASRGMISDSELMIDANKAMLLGVADTGEELATLLQIAGERAKAMGTTTASAFDDLLTAIGRQSTMIADNLGITFSLEEAYQNYADTLGTTADKLTDTQKKQAFLNEVLRQSEEDLKAAQKSMGDTEGGIVRMTTAWTNFRTEVGKTIAPNVEQTGGDVANFLDWFGQTFLSDTANATRNVSNLTIAIKQMQDQLAGGMLQEGIRSNLEHDLAGAVNELRAMTGYNRQLKDDDITQTLMSEAHAAETGASSMEAMALKADNLARVLAGLKAQSDATASALAGIASAAIGAVHSAASAAVGIMPAAEIARIYGANTKQMEEQIKVMKSVGMTTDDIDFKMQEMAKKASLPFDIAVEAARAAEKQNTATAKSVDSLSQEYQDLAGKVQGVLSGALDPGVGVDPQDVLEKLGFPREDAINENARRLADIAANGLKDQDWLGEFKNEVPDIWNMIRLAQNPQEEAARLLQDFQDGLLTSPIDKEKAKEIVKRSILGDQNMAALATEIATELAAEMGIPMQEALAAAQGTLGGGKGMGSEAATTFSEDALAAMEDEDGGGSFVSTFVDQARAKYSLLATAGTDAAKTWGDAFLAKVGDSVPPALINLLTDLVTPEVINRMNQRGTLTGATP
jgi:antitoxin component of RelBE/YafQ-DinJ toxin-antitoxin module